MVWCWAVFSLTRGLLWLRVRAPQEVEDVKNKVVWGWAASAVTCCAFGYALGRLSARDGRRGR